VLFTGFLLTACSEEPWSFSRSDNPDAPFARSATSIAPDLQAVVKDERLHAFYEARAWQPAWSDRNAAALEAALKDAPRHGMNPEQFLRLVASSDNRAEYDASLTLTALSYADALAHGLVRPAEVHKIYTLPNNQVDVAAGLEEALANGDVGQWLLGLAPADAEYRALSDAYLHFRMQVVEAGTAPIPTGKLIREGDNDPRIPAIARVLDVTAAPSAPVAREASETTTNASEEASGPTLFTPELAAAVKALQTAHGLKPDGIIGNDTIALLNTGAADRTRQLAVNMERRRWLERDPPATRIDVNTGATFLTYIVDGQKAWATKTINGQPQTPTPNLGSMMFQLVANPPWHVPESIAEEEIFPKGEAYLLSNNMVVKDGKIIQSPGPGSALGEVKFDLKNDYAIYLHDTPTKKLFAQTERHLSHGCVRVENPLELARLIATQNGKLEEFEQKLASRDTGVVELATEIPVRLLYHTAYLDESGTVAFRADTYGWDEDVAEAMGLGKGNRRTFAALAAPLGP
jgi:murein L,D-transpeptidase YcbB/YkuD